MTTVPPRDAQGKPLTAYIYALADPQTNAIRYVGKTTDSLSQRLSNHISEKKDDRKNRWINKLKRSGLKPLIQLIEEVPIDQWRERECYWIAFYRSQGCDLTNTALGGQGGEGHSPETKAKIAATNLGKSRGPEFSAKMKKVMADKKGKKRPPEVGAKVSAAMTGRKRTDNGRRGKKHTPESRAKMSIACKKAWAIWKNPPDTPTLWD